MEVLDQESEDRAELYRCRPLVRIKVPILVQPVAVNNDIPAEEEIELAVWGMKCGRAGGLLVMRAEDLKGWRKEAKRKN